MLNDDRIPLFNDVYEFSHMMAAAIVAEQTSGWMKLVDSYECFQITSADQLHHIRAEKRA